MDFVVHAPDKCAYEDEIVSLGGRVFRCARPVRILRFHRELRSVLREHGPYDVVHSHVTYPGLVLRVARKLGVPVRVAHSHNDAPVLKKPGAPFQSAVVAWTNRWVFKHATHGLACSRKAAEALFGRRWESDPRWRLFYYGIDMGPFTGPVDPAAVRAELNVPPGAWVVGHVGRFELQKNHTFLLEIAAEVARRAPDMRLLLVGGGSLEPQIRAKAAALGLADRVIYAGVRADVARLMRGAMDTFLLPSLYEGLPLVGLEAQTAGLPVVLSDVISDELDRLPLITRVPLGRPASAWADAVLATRSRPRPPQSECLAELRPGPFNIDNSIRELERLYLRAAEEARAGVR
jgi:glycosyltransferase involved in cell wall biosynthesis